MIFFQMARSGALTITPVKRFFAPTLTDLDPEIPNLPLEDATGGFFARYYYDMIGQAT